MGHLDNLDAPLFPAAVVAVAANVSPATLRQWIVRYADDMGLWDAAPGKAAGEKAESEGLGHRFSLRGALQLAAAARLVAKGVPVKTAYKAAEQWVHFGDHDRSPAGLHPDGLTFLVHHAADESRVINVAVADGHASIPLSDLFPTGNPVKVSPTIVFLNDIDRFVRGVCEGYLRP